MQSQRSVTPPCPGMKEPKFCKARRAFNISHISYHVSGLEKLLQDRFLPFCVWLSIDKLIIQLQISFVAGPSFIKMQQNLSQTIFLIDRGETSMTNPYWFVSGFLALRLHALLKPDARNPPKGPMMLQMALIMNAWARNG